MPYDHRAHLGDEIDTCRPGICEACRTSLRRAFGPGIAALIVHLEDLVDVDQDPRIPENRAAYHEALQRWEQDQDRALRGLYECRPPATDY